MIEKVGLTDETGTLTTFSAVQGYRKAVVTPNAMEFSRLVKTILCKDVAPSVLPDPKLVAELSTALGHVTVVHKGNTVHPLQGCGAQCTP